MIAMMPEVSRIQSTTQARISGRPRTNGSTWFSSGTPTRMPRKGKTASHRIARMRQRLLSFAKKREADRPVATRAQGAEAQISGIGPLRELHADQVGALRSREKQRRPVF